jgi:citrate lyase subunit beta / citryl-CoA lyase
LFVPGDRPDQMQKALGSGADALVLDLEDAVAAQRKGEARTHVAAFLEGEARSRVAAFRESEARTHVAAVPESEARTHVAAVRESEARTHVAAVRESEARTHIAAVPGRGPRIPRIFVRVNPLTTAFCVQDLSALKETMPDALLLPKAEGSGSIIELLRRMDLLGIRPVPILPIATETPAAVFRLSEFAAVSDRLIGLTWGAEDLSAAIGAAASREGDGRLTPPYETVRALALFAAHAAAVPAIETVYPAFRDLAGLSVYAGTAARDGFTGMMAIHPSQVAIINAAFTPSSALVDRARRIVAAFRSQPGAGVVNLDGVMLDAPHLRQALRVLALADQAPPEN